MKFVKEKDLKGVKISNAILIAIGVGIVDDGTVSVVGRFKVGSKEINLPVKQEIEILGNVVLGIVRALDIHSAKENEAYSFEGIRNMPCRVALTENGELYAIGSFENETDRFVTLDELLKNEKKEEEIS